MFWMMLLQLKLSSQLRHFSARQRWTYWCEPSSSSVYEAFVKLATFVAFVTGWPRYKYLFELWALLPKGCRISLIIDQYHYELCMVYMACFTYLESMLIESWRLWYMWPYLTCVRSCDASGEGLRCTSFEDPKTVSQNGLNLVSIYPTRLHWSTLSGKEQISTDIWQQLRKVSMLWFLFTQRKNFTCSILLCHSVEIGFNQMVPLILKEWQPGGQLKQMERIYFTRCMSILKVTTRNGQIKSRKRRI